MRFCEFLFFDILEIISFCRVTFELLSVKMFAVILKYAEQEVKFIEKCKQRTFKYVIKSKQTIIKTFNYVSNE